MIPPLIKQNTGLAFLGSAGLALLMLMAIEAWHRRRAAGYAWTIWRGQLAEYFWRWR